MRHHQRTERSEQELRLLHITDTIIMITKIIAGSFRAGAASHRPLVNPNCPKSFASNTFWKREKGLPPVCDSQIGG